jgi:hypothetical protein
MTDEQKMLVERLRSVDISWSQTGEWCAEAADLIEALEAENARLRERLTQAIERLRDMLQCDDGQAWDEAGRFVDIIAQETQP